LWHGGPRRVTSPSRIVGPAGRAVPSVARVCELTSYCSRNNLHPTPAGHALIADEILRMVPLAGP
jgi:phospholipase/lecithinase/hemolysin